MPSDKYEIMSGSKLTVRESQVAVFVHKGKIADIFQPGQYTLSTNNLPVLSGLRALLYQGRDVVVKSDVYFVNTKQFTNLKWGTKNPITMRDADFGMVRVGAFGTYSMRVFDAERFLKELFGTNSTFTVADINDHLKSLLVSQMADTVAESKIPMLDMAANLQEFSAMCRTNITEKFREYGLDITSFTIENISLPQEVEKVLDERTSLGILGDKMGTYTQKKAADALGDAARNTGTLAAKGDYITYVDGDDFLHPVCVESLYGLIERYRADLAVCTMKTFQEKPDEVIRQTTGQTACFEREKALEHMLYQRLFDTSACGKLYRTEDARGQLFPVGRLFEDLATVYRFLWRAERTAWESDALYGYRTRGDSIMNQRFREGRFDELTAIDELCDFVRENCPSVQRAADCRRFSCLCQTLLAIPPEDARYRGRAEAIFAELCRLRWRVLSDPRARMKNRGAAALTLLGERGFRRCAAARG